jgi:hypothetical protein
MRIHTPADHHYVFVGNTEREIPIPKKYATVLLVLPTRVEAGSNTSTMNLRVVRGDEMGQKKAAS